MRGDPDRELPRHLLRAVAAMTELLDNGALAELERALSLRIAGPPSAAKRRMQELGPLAELLRLEASKMQRGLDAILSGVDVPQLTRDDYDTSCRLHAPGAPTSQTLSAAYGDWRRACIAAHGLLPDGRYRGCGQPWAAARRGRKRVPTYSRGEVGAALRLCSLELGRRPSSSDYCRWSSEKRRALSARGVDIAHQATAEQRIPSIGVLYRHYGGKKNAFTTAIGEAQLNDLEIAIARTQRLLASINVPLLPQGPLAQLELLDAEALTAAGIDETKLTLIREQGFGMLPFAEAVLIARTLDGSLDWLAGCAIEPGKPSAGGAFRPDQVKQLMKVKRVESRQLIDALGLSHGPYRRIMNAADVPTLAEAAIVATVLQVSIDGLAT
jgi:hypothetical protein